jgi:DNA-3-methyladenine glycosylase I
VPRLIPLYCAAIWTSPSAGAGRRSSRISPRPGAAIQNAQRFLAVQQEFGAFDAYIWQFVGGKPIVNTFGSPREIPPKTAISDAMSKDLKKRGFKFVGSTICYAFMQAAGLVNDHITVCFRHGR